MDKNSKRPKWKSFLEDFLCCFVTAVIGIILLIGVIILFGVLCFDLDSEYALFLIPIGILAGMIFLPIILHSKKN